MRVLHVTPSYLPATRYGGPIYSVHGLCSALAGHGHEVDVFTTNIDGDGVSDVPVGTPVDMDGVQVTYFPLGLGRRIARSPAMGAALEDCVAAYDIVHVHSVFLWPTTAAAMAARRNNVPYVLSPRGMLVPELIRRKSRLAKTLWIKLYERKNIEMASALHVTADIEAGAIHKLGLSVRRTIVLPNGTAAPSFTRGNELPHPATRSRAPTILFLGRVNWKKGLDRLIPAMSRVPNARLIVVGNDEENYRPQLESIAEQCGVGERVEFRGPLYAEDKWRAFAEADLFVLPSYSENFGISVLEAMAAGLPVIVTPEVGLASTVSDAGAGIVVNCDEDNIGRSIAQLISDPVKMEECGRAGREAVRTQFSWDGIASKMQKSYADVLEARCCREEG
ncbi:MAG: glycosyltransferase [Pseudomonadota bacterium]